MFNLLLQPALKAGSMMGEGNGIFKPLYWVFGKFMELLLSMMNNEYFIAIIVFTVLTRLVLLPLNIRQQKSTAKNTRLQPKIQKIQKKYPDPKDRMKVNQETQDLYAREGHNPMSMGCGPMVFQMIFLMGIVGVIYYPLSYILEINFTDASVKQAIGEYLKNTLDYSGNYLQLGILENWAANRDAFISQWPELFTADKAAAIDSFREGMYIGNMDMTVLPSWKSSVVLIPILSLLTSLGSSVVSMLIQKKNNPAAAQQMGSMMMMMLMMPLFSFFIAFKLPAAVGFYWTVSNVVAILQQLFLAKFFPPKKSQARDMIENTIQRRAREQSIKRTKAQ